MTSVRAAAKPEESAVLSKAFLRASERLGLTQKYQARILGLSAASLSRLARGEREVDVEGKEGELALLLVRLYRSLERHVLRQAPMVPLYHTLGVVAVHDHVNGLEPGPLGLAKIELERVWLERAETAG